MSANKIVTGFISSPSSRHWNSRLFLFSHFGHVVKTFPTKLSSSSTLSISTLCGLSHGGRLLSSSPPPPTRTQSNVNTRTNIFDSNASLSVAPTFKNIGKHCSSIRNFHSSGKASEVPHIQIPKKSSLCPKSVHSKTSFTLDLKDAKLSLRRGDHTPRCLPLIWLRDHCRCQSCYNSDTNQKENVHLNLLEDGTTDVHKVCLEGGDRTLVVHWKDGHVSNYCVDWLVSNSYSDAIVTSKVKRVLWNGDVIKEEGGPLPVSYANHVETEEGLRQTLQNLVEYGFSIITQAPSTLEGNKTVTDRVAPIQETFFGGMWQFTSDGAFSDTAYSTGYLSPHTDNTYLEMPAGIQVFHCLGHDGSGGETLLVDGFHAVEQLRQSHPHAVRCLSSHLVPHEYKEDSPGHHMYTLCPVIRLHPTTEEVLYLRFNPYDRAPLNTIPPDEMLDFYQSYQLLSRVIADPKGHHWVKLTPGTIVLIDNWRVMHGRSAFDGRRVMSGCYLRRDDWMSKVRIMGLEDGI